MNTPPEVWLRGPVEGIPPLLQPVAHSLLQCREEVVDRLGRLTPSQLGDRPRGAASIAYHVVHAAGSLDRLFTYARGEQLSTAQMESLRAERELSDLDAATLIARFEAAVDRALVQLRTTSDTTLLERRAVGRARLPSTVIGLLFHAAEHAQRHIGQMATTARIVSARIEPTQL